MRRRQQAQFSAEKEGAEAEAAQMQVMQNTADQNNATLGASADEYRSSVKKDARRQLVQKGDMGRINERAVQIQNDCSN